MAKEIMTPAVHASGFTDVLMLGASKSISERLLAPVIGNATIKSGGIKLFTGAVIGGKGGKLGRAFSGGLVVDGVEDIVSALIGNGIPGMPGGNSEESW